MKETIYIFSNGRIKRKENTIFFETDEGKKKFIPVENVKEIFAFGEIDLNVKALNFLSQKRIILHYFNYYEYYSGSFYPREHYNSGYMILNQVKFYLDTTQRLFLAKQFVIGATKNTLKTLKYYDRREKSLTEFIDTIESISLEIIRQENITKLMSIEGEIKKVYYSTFPSIMINPDFEFTKRSKRPPKDMINALISFSNSIIYNYVLSEIYNTHLDPRIGYLHSTNFRRFTLNLDVAEIFKPIIGDRTIFQLVNKGIIDRSDFEKALNRITLNDKGKKKFLQKMEEKLKQTIKHHQLNKKISYRRLIRLELYKLEKHLIDEQEYVPFVMDW